MKKILISEWVPEECLLVYQDRYKFTVPTKEKRAFSYGELYKMINDYDGCLILDTDVDKNLIDQASNLKVLGNFGAGYNNIDWKYATAVFLPVVNTPTAAREATAEHAIAMILSTMRGVTRYDREIRRGIWNSPNFSDLNSEVFGKTLGIMGFGRIGKAVCKKARGLGMKVLYNDIQRATTIDTQKYQAKFMSFEEILYQSDCITLHMPYHSGNHHLFNEDAFKKMKKNAYFINVSRGPIVDEKALTQALIKGEIKGASLDVFENEPRISPELLALETVTFTPHVASNTMNTHLNMCREALEGIVGVLEGDKPYNVINPETLGHREPLKFGKDR